MAVTLSVVQVCFDRLSTALPEILVNQRRIMKAQASLFQRKSDLGPVLYKSALNIGTFKASF